MAQVNEERALLSRDGPRLPRIELRPTKEMATSTSTRVVEENNDSNAFVANAIVVAVGIFIVGFDYSKVKVVEAFSGVDLHYITLPIG